MWIMTAEGWRELQPREIVKAEEPKAYNGVPAPYAGEFPSKDLCEVVNRIKEQLKFFDDGLRMVYRGKDKRVQTDNMAPGNIIAYPPKGWEEWQ